VSSAPFHLTVCKIGGSVLTGIAAYQAATRALGVPDPASSERLVVVVSAEYGHTDALFGEATQMSAVPDSAALDLLWSTGELRSVALLTLALQSAGIPAVGLNVHETGLRVGAGDDRLELNPLALRAALAHHSVVVVPGFLATRHQRVVSLGRGGSDWTAVSLAAALGAHRCELFKDVDGYFTADPNAAGDARPIAALTFADALQFADDGCPLVQRQAIVAARDAGMTLVVRSFTGSGTSLSSHLVAQDPSLKTQD
jgi:aspartate kinase